MEIRKEIQRQGAIYDKEENKAIKLITLLHSGTKDAHKECLTILKGLQKEWSDNKAERIRELVDGMKDSVAKVKKLKNDLNGHQAFRNSFCTRNKCIDLLGQRNYKELNTIYLGFREGPLKEYAALEDKITKIAEHHKRGEQCLAMLPRLNQQFEVSSQAALEMLREDANRIQKIWNDFESTSGNYAGSLKSNTYDALKAHKKRPVTPPMMKQMQTTIAQHEKKIKARRSELKTCQQILKDAPKKAGDAAKTTEGKQLLKRMKSDLAQFEKAISEWMDIHKKTSVEWGKVDKAIAKASK